MSSCCRVCVAVFLWWWHPSGEARSDHRRQTGTDHRVRPCLSACLGLRSTIADGWCAVLCLYRLGVTRIDQETFHEYLQVARPLPSCVSDCAFSCGAVDQQSFHTGDVFVVVAQL